MKSPVKWVKDIGRFLVLIFANVFMPSPIRRIFFITSVYVLLARGNVIKGDVEGKLESCLRRLNTRMAIVKFENAMVFPAVMADSFWHDRNLLRTAEETIQFENGCITPNSSRELSDKLVGLAPSWLRYEPDGMRNDIMLMLNVCEVA